MDRDDARFAASALASRISGDREALDRLQATSFVRLTASAVALKRAAADWPPAHLAALELETIAKHGADAAAGEPHQDLQKVVDSLTKLADEKPPRNRFERRKAASGRMARKQRRERMRELERIQLEAAQ